MGAVFVDDKKWRKIVADVAEIATQVAKVGVLPDGGALWSVPRKVGHAKARELFGLARQFDADEALRIGLVNQVSDEGTALAAATSSSPMPHSKTSASPMAPA